MTGLNFDQGAHRTLAALALALVNRPRASVQDLAKAIGVGTTTLHRFRRTRGELVERLIHHTTQVLDNAITEAQLDSLPPRKALHHLSALSVEQRELTAFLMFYWKDSNVLSPLVHATKQR